ncbi:MAG: ABC transporter permease [Blastocatellia bacterium]|nr:ABC transporter permease [Blastocatellia bacterium]
MSWPVLVSALALISLVTVIVGVIPALLLNYSQLTNLLQRNERVSSRGKLERKLQSGFSIVQIAFSFALYTGAVLLLQTLWQLQHLPLGFDPRNILTSQISLLPNKYFTDEEIRQFFRALLDKIQGIPGVEAAAISSAPPFGSVQLRTSLVPPTFQSTAKEQAQTPDAEYISRRYFDVLKIPLVLGRDFNLEDGTESPAVVIVNQTLATRFWPARVPIGATLVAPSSPAPRPLSVIGVVGSVLRGEVSSGTPAPCIYFPFAQRAVPDITLLVRTKAGYDPVTLEATIRETVDGLDPNQPIYNVSPMTATVAASLTPVRLAAYIVGIFSILALSLVGVGLYGVLTYAVGRQTQEIGIRLALGAQRRSVLMSVIKTALRLSALGIGLGIACSFALKQVLTAFVPDLSTLTVLTFSMAAGIMLGVGLLASILPAWRATRVDPGAILRADL